MTLAFGRAFPSVNGHVITQNGRSCLFALGSFDSREIAASGGFYLGRSEDKGTAHELWCRDAAGQNRPSRNFDSGDIKNRFTGRSQRLVICLLGPLSRFPGLVSIPREAIFPAGQRTDGLSPRENHGYAFTSASEREFASLTNRTK